MEIVSCYGVKIKHYNHIFKQTVELYRKAVAFFLVVCEKEWDTLSQMESSNSKLSYIEKLTHRTQKNPDIRYNFDLLFYKFPSYLRRAAINEATGKFSSYQTYPSCVQMALSWEGIFASSQRKRLSYTCNKPDQKSAAARCQDNAPSLGQGKRHKR